MIEEDLKGDILIVDDIAENIKVLANILEDKNYKVRKALNGKIALRSLRSNPPDLILLDIKMPEMDGYEVCQQIKADPETQDIPIIFISALNEVFDKVKAFQLGGSDYITKPFQIEEVIARIENQLTIQRQKKQLEEEIDKRKDAEEILYQSRALLASILNTSLDGIAALQAVRKPLSAEIEDFRCLTINPVFSEMISSYSDNLVGKLIGKKLISRIAPQLFNKFVDLVENGGTLQEDIFYKNGDQDYWYHFIAIKLGDGFSLTVRDITKIKKVELQLKSLANIDGLTKIANRRLFDQTIEEEWRRHLRVQQSLSLIITDVDFFKRYNDFYGHIKGDQCLSQIAQTISRCVKRAGELVARYGGEEFAIILPNTDQKNALELAKLIKEQVHKLQIDHQASDVKNYVTISIGIATIIPDNNCSLTKFINLADRALYKAKESGRDRLICGKFN